MRKKVVPYFQNSKKHIYSNHQGLFDGESGLLNYNESIVTTFHTFMAADTNGADSLKNESIIDFGAGAGHLADIFLSKFSIKPICVELDPTLLELLLSKKYLAVKNLKDIDQAAAVIYSSNVLEHIEDDSKALNDIASNLQKGGKLLVYVPALMFLFSDLDFKAGHFRRYGKKELIQKITDAGFRVEKCFYNDSLGVPASLALKMLGYRNKLNLGTGKSLVFYDTKVYPVSQLLDRIGMKYVMGKNLYLFAIKK